MNIPEPTIPILPAVDFTLALESSRIGLARRYTTVADSLPFTRLAARLLPLSSLPGLANGGPVLIDPHPEVAWLSLWEKRRELHQAPSSPVLPTPSASLPTPQRPLPDGSRLAGMPWQDQAMAALPQERMPPRYSLPDPTDASIGDLPVPASGLPPAARLPGQPGPVPPTDSPGESMPPARLHPARSGFGRLLVALPAVEPDPADSHLRGNLPMPQPVDSNLHLPPSLAGSWPSSEQRAENLQPAAPPALARPGPQLPSSSPWKRRLDGGQVRGQGVPGRPADSGMPGPQLEPLRPGTDAAPAEQTALIDKSLPATTSAVRLPVMGGVVERLVQRKVRVEISRQHNATQPPAEAPAPPDFTNDEVVRGLMRRMQVLAQEDRFRLGRLP